MNENVLVWLLGFFICLGDFAFGDGVRQKPAIGPWLMDLQLGQPMANLQQVDPAQLAQAPPEIKEKYEQEQKQFQAEEHLKQLGTNVVPELLTVLRTSKDLNEKEHALIAIDHLRPPPEMVLNALAEYLNQGELAETAALVLARQGPAAIGPLISSRTNRIEAVREAIAWHLADFHPDEHGELRISVNGDVRVWRNFKSHAAMISPALMELLKDEDPTVRFRAALSLGDVGGDGAVIVPALVKCLKDKERTVRGDAVAALGKLGKAAQVAFPALTECLHDPDETVRREAAFALSRLK
jgi:hypothetical protein